MVLDSVVCSCCCSCSLCVRLGYSSYSCEFLCFNWCCRLLGVFCDVVLDSVIVLAVLVSCVCVSGLCCVGCWCCVCVWCLIWVAVCVVFVCEVVLDAALLCLLCLAGL